MVVSKLASGLRNVISSITSASIVDQQLLKSSLKELQRTLISSDVNVRLVLDLSKKIESRMTAEKPPAGISQKEYFIKIVYEELVNLMGEEYTPSIKPQKILLCGTYGHGKTTTTAKLAKFYSKRGLKTCIITTDTWRPAAYEQVEQLSKKVGVPMFGIKGEKNAELILKQGIEKFKDFEVIIVDSAGRDSLEDGLIAELTALDGILKADEKFLVIGADMGQTAGKQAEAMNNAINLTGVIITRLDSSAKGGGAVSACAIANVPITFIGEGEKIDDLDVFSATRYVSSLLGFGDLTGLLQKVKDMALESDLTEEELLTEKFTLKTFYKQLEATKKMGSLSKIIEMMGMSAKLPDEVVEQSEEKLKTYKVVIDSMTKKETESPELIKSSRIARIARGSGRSEKEVRELLKQFKMTEKMFSKVKKGKRMPKNIQAMMKKFGGMNI